MVYYCEHLRYLIRLDIKMSLIYEFQICREICGVTMSIFRLISFDGIYQTVIPPPKYPPRFIHLFKIIEISSQFLNIQKA